MINQAEKKRDIIRDALNELYVSLKFPRQYVNLFGIRDESSIDMWNDVVGYFTTDGFCHVYQATTDPGKFYTDRPMNPGGAAWMAEGFHQNLWMHGLHRGYPALVQKNKVRVTRDIDKEYKPGDSEMAGYYGINLHRAHPVYEVDTIGRYGAGCQVIRKPRDWNELHTFLLKHHQRGYSYMLLSRERLKDITGVEL